MKRQGNGPGFAFVGNPINFNCELPFEISTSLKLRRAEVSERRTIKRYLRSLGEPGIQCAPFECTFHETPLEPAAGPGTIPVVFHERTRLPSSMWRYYIVEFAGYTPSLVNGCEEIILLRAASRLTGSPLRLNPFFTRVAMWSDFIADWEHFTGIAPSGGQIAACDATHLGDLRHCYSAVLDLKSTHPDIVRSILMYQNLHNGSGPHDLTILGYFSVLESLLTHSPRGEYDSIGQQIQKKIALLERRWRQRLDYACFGGANPDTVWKKLYEFRSRIAHGGEIDFERSLRLLCSASTVHLFLRTAVRAFLRGAVDEPDLYMDLREV